MALTKKRLLFIDWYVKTHNGAESARQAGYSPRVAKVEANRLLTIDAVKQAIEAKEQDLRKRYKLDKDSYIQKTYELFEAEQNPQVKKQYWELLGKAEGWTDVNRTIVNNNVFGDMSPKELLEKVSAIRSNLLE